MLVLLSRTIIITIFFFFSMIACAKDAELTRMFSDIVKKQSTQDLNQQAVRLGKDRAILCNQCHGEDGNSKKPDVPNLASQNPNYLLEQIEKFANENRKNYVMNALSKNFTSDDKVNLALFYASMPVKPVKTNARFALKGKPLYKNQCSSCHGEQGLGKANFARLAGQQSKYVESTLRSFRGNEKDKTAGDLSKRRSVVMESISKTLSDEDMKFITAYIAQLK